MRFKGYMISEDRSQSITEEQAVKGVQKDCKKMLSAYKKGQTLFRGNYYGLDVRNDFIFIKPKGQKRTSANTTNMYTLIIDNHPKWKKYPKRSDSIICSTGYDTAEQYGDVYRVFPKDGATYGICSTPDIWSSFKSFGDQWLEDVNSDILNLAQELGVATKALKGKNYRDLMMMFTEMDNQIIHQDVIVKYKLEWAKSNYDYDMLKMLQEFFDPVANGFKIVKNPTQLPSQEKEVWTDADSYMISDKWLKNNEI